VTRERVEVMAPIMAPARSSEWTTSHTRRLWVSRSSGAVTCRLPATRLSQDRRRADDNESSWSYVTTHHQTLVVTAVLAPRRLHQQDEPV